MIVKDLFISYGRRESLGFVGRLHQRLKLVGYDVWFDKVNIPDGDDYVLRINQGIESAHNFVYVMAPRCLTSPHCLVELEYARLLGKRVIPINQMVIFQTETSELSATDQEILRNFYATHEIPDPNIKTTQQVLIRSHELIGHTHWLDAKELLNEEDCQHLAIWAQSYENFWIKHDELDYLQQFEFPIFGRSINTLDGTMGRLMLLLEKHSDYVHQHTQVLNAALIWQRHQRQVHYLLVGSERLQAEDWLLTDFVEGEQAPCCPTDLQCEFICESRKNNCNVMTQVFICHEFADSMICQQIVRELARWIITTWQPDHDVHEGTTLEQAVERGIEAADNFLYIISYHSIHSEYCNKALDHALNYHKRIIPILVDPVSPHDIPEKMSSLKQIDYTGGIKIDTLIKIINHNKIYYEQHKILLVLALKWQREKEKPSFLLRGHNLANALLWLRLHQDHYEHPPTEYHRLLITTSEAAKGQLGCEAFISYSRKDSDFARKLNLALQEAGKTTWFDQESISSGVDFAREIFKGIDGSDNFILILSPDAIQSPYCEKEVSYAYNQHKRLIPLLYRMIDPANIPEALQPIQWLDFYNVPFSKQFPDLIQTIELDREHAHQHTLWQQRAIEWDNHHQSSDFLLNSTACQRAEQWLKVAQAEGKQPFPTEIQQQYLSSSRVALNARTRRQKRRLIFTNILFTLSLLMGIAAIWKWWEAYQHLHESQNIQSLFLADLSRQQTEQERPVEGLLLALEALPHNVERTERPYTIQATVSLYNALYQLHEEKVLQHDDTVRYVTLSDDEQQVLTASQDGTARIWEMMSGKLLKTLQGHKDTVSQAVFSNDGQWVLTGSWDKTARIWSVTGSEQPIVLRGHQDKIHSVALSHHQQWALTASADKTARIWNVTRGEELITLQGHQGSISQAIFSSDDQRVLTASNDHTARIWSVRDGQLLVTLQGHQGLVYHAIWSPDEQTILTASADRTARIWSANDGQLLVTLQEHQAPVYDALFDKTGERIITVSADNTARIWDAKSGRLLTTLKGHEGSVYHAAFSPDGQKVVTVSADRTARIWSGGQLLTTLRGHQGHIHHVAFGSHRIITAGADQTARIWNVTNPFLLTLREHLGPVHYATLSGTKIATASVDGTACLWEWSSEKKPIILRGHQGSINQVTFSRDGRKVVTASDDHTAKVWSTEGTLLATLVGHQGPIKRAVFSPDGQQILTVSRDKTARIWSATEGQLLAILQGHQGTVNDGLFSADNQRAFTVSDDQTVRVWKAGELLMTLPGHEGHIHHLVLSADERQLITASDDKTARIWETQSGNLLFTLRGHEKKVNHVAFSPDGLQALTASADGTARIWSTISGQLLMVLKGHEKGVHQAIFNTNGQKVLTASEDNTARIWESASGQPLLILQGHRGPVYRAQFSDDEQWVLTASQEGTARVWRVFESVQTLIDQANLLKPRDLTIEQRKQFFLSTIDENSSEDSDILLK